MFTLEAHLVKINNDSVEIYSVYPSGYLDLIKMCGSNKVRAHSLKAHFLNQMPIFVSVVKLIRLCPWEHMFFAHHLKQFLHVRLDAMHFLYGFFTKTNTCC